MDREMNDRLDRLEADYRRLAGRQRFWKSSSVVAWLGLAVLISAGARPLENPKEVSANRFVLRDELGNARATLGFEDGKNGPSFCLFDVQGRGRVRLIAESPGEVGLEVWDKNGRQRLGLGINPDDTVGMQLDGKAERRAVVLGVDGEGFGGLSIEKGGRPRIGLGFVKGQILGVLSDQDGKERLGIRVGADGSPSLQLNDGDGRPIFQAPKHP